MPGVVAHVPNEGAKFVPVSTEILARCASEVVAYFREALCSAIGLDDEDDLRVLYAERELCDGDEKQEEAFKGKLESGKPCVVRVLFRLLGGKGGFGALLRKQANKGKKTKNFDAMRDLTGRRLRHSTAVDRIKEWMEKQKVEDELVNLIAGEGPELPKPVPASESLDPEFVRKLKRTAAAVPGVVTAGLRALDAAEEQEYAKRPRADASGAAAAASSSSAFAASFDALADISGSSEEASPDGEEAEDASAAAKSELPAASSAKTKPDKEEKSAAAAPAAAPASSASAIAEAIAESFCAATERATEGGVQERVQSRTRREKTGSSENVAPAAAVACIGPAELKGFKDAAALEAKVSAEVLKQSLQKLGLKCGGTPMDRALRLFQLKLTALEDLPKKDFAK